MSITSPLARRLAAGAAAVLVLAACGGDGDGASTDDASTAESEMSDDDMSDDEMSDDEMSEDEMSDEEGSHSDDMSDDETSEDEDAAGGGELSGLTATAADGSTFALADFEGGPVLVETFATWCGNCRRQLGDTQEAAAQAGDDAVFLALSVETDLDPAELERYAADNGFGDIRFGVVDEAGLSALQERYGGAVLTPPATPKFRVGADGSLSELQTGPESTDEILESLGV